MKVAALVSGGKDSCYNIMQCIAAGHEIVALANLIPHNLTEIDSFMYQSVGHEAIDLIAQSMQLPLYRQETCGKSHQHDLNYHPTENDEVEDLYKLLEMVKNKINFDAVSVGAILSDYQRIRVENVCSRLGLVCLSYLWQRDQAEILQEMIKCDVDAIIIKVAALGLEPSRHLGRSVRLVEPHLHVMHEKYGLNVCGEGGEYETLVLDCPLYSSRIVIEESEIVLHSDDAIAPVGFMKLNQLRLDMKLPALSLSQRLSSVPLKDSEGYVTDEGEEACEIYEEEMLDLPKSKTPIIKSFQAQEPTYSKSNDGWLCIGGLSADTENPQESTSKALETLKSTLASNGHNLVDICSVTMYINDMSQFVELNKAYLATLNHVNPPARACVQVPLPNNCPVLFEALSWLPPCVPTGDSQIDRHTMHVQSVSHWAPANIGPYSQAVRVGEVIHLAGQIGLVPGNMELVKGGVKAQCRLALRHIGRVLKAVDPNVNLRDVVQALCYVTDISFIDPARKIWESKTNNAIVSYVVASGLPRNALVEWHVWAHRHNKEFEYEETGKCIEDWSVSIYRRSNYENNVAAVVCHIDSANELHSELPVEIFREALYYTFIKLQQGHESDVTCLCSFKVFYAVKKQMMLEDFVSLLKQFHERHSVVYTFVPVIDLGTTNTYLSISAVRCQ